MNLLKDDTRTLVGKLKNASSAAGSKGANKKQAPKALPLK